MVVVKGELGTSVIRGNSRGVGKVTYAAASHDDTMNWHGLISQIDVHSCDAGNRHTIASDVDVLALFYSGVYLIEVLIELVNRHRRHAHEVEHSAVPTAVPSLPNLWE